MQELIDAIKAGNEELAINLIIEGHFDPNAEIPRLKSGEPSPTPLHYAVQNGLINVMKCLINHGASVDYEVLSVDGFLTSPTTWAIDYNQLDALKELWKNSQPHFVQNNKVEKAWILSKAAEKGNLEMVKWLIEQGFPIDGDEPLDEDEKLVPLASALYEGHYDIVEYLLEKGASIDRVIEEDGFMDLLKSLLFEKEGFRFSNKSLVIAIDNFEVNEEIEDLIEKGYDLEHVDHEGITILQAAILKEKINVIESLLDVKVDVNKTDSKGFNALDYALCSQNPQIIGLFDSKGFGVAERQIQGNKHGLWAVMQDDSEYVAEAIKFGKEEAIQTMQEKGLNFNHRTGNLLKSPLHYAVDKGYQEVVSLLITFGADVNVIDADGFSPISKAALNSDTDVVSTLIDKGGESLHSIPPILLTDTLRANFDTYNAEIIAKLLSTGIHIDYRTFRELLCYKEAIEKICEEASKYDFKKALEILIPISRACFEHKVAKHLNKEAKDVLHQHYSKKGYKEVIKNLEEIIKSRTSQTDRSKKYKEAIKLFGPIMEFEEFSKRSDEDDIVEKIKDQKNIILDAPFPYIQSKIFPEQDLLSKISQFIEPKKQIVFTEICKHTPIFPQLQQTINEDEIVSKVQVIGDNKHAQMDVTS